MSRTKQRPWRAHGVLLAGTALMMAGEAKASQVIGSPVTIPPSINVSNLDKNGVDRASGSFSSGSPLALQAPGAGHMVFRSQTNGWQFTNNLDPTLFEQTSVGGENGSEWDIKVDAGDKSRLFFCEYAGAAFDCTQTDTPDGAMLVVSNYSVTPQRVDPKEYTFTDPQGTAFVYDSIAIQLTSGAASGNGLLQSVLYGDGEKITVTTGSTPFVSNLGFKITRSGNNYSLYKGATLLNTLIQSETVSGSSSTVTESDDLSRSYTSHWSGGCGGHHLDSAISPGGVETDVTYTASAVNLYGADQVATLSRGGETWHYTVTTSGVTATDPLSNATVTQASPQLATASYGISAPCVAQYQYGLVTSLQDPLSRTTSFSYAGTLPYQTTQPEGDSETIDRDDRGNVVKRTHKAKPGSGLSDVIVYQAGFDTVCGNPRTCNQPNWTKDALGNETDDTYYAHGGLATVTLPADAGSLRKRTYLTYEAYDTGDGIIYRPTRSETCGLTSAQLSLTACPALSTTAVTTTAYWQKTFLPLTVTQTDGAGSLSATTTYAYDDWGHVISVDGPLPGAVDVSYTTYDAVGRKVFEIGVDPDGAGALKRTIVKHTYDADDHETRTDTGTGNATDGSDFVVSAFKRMTYDSLGRLVKTETVQP